MHSIYIIIKVWLLPYICFDTAADISVQLLLAPMEILTKYEKIFFGKIGLNY
jgi:hypothetical protein